MKNFITHYILLMIMFSAFVAQGHGQQALLSYENETTKEPDNLVKFKTQDEFLLAGYYYLGAPQSPGVLLLHDCASDGASYDASESIV